MKFPRLLVVAAAIFFGLLSAGRLFAAALEDEVRDIQERIRAKAQAGKASESDLARELNELSDLHLKYRTQKPQAAEILLVRAYIYEQVIKDKEMAFAIYIQIATEYPDTPAAYVAASTIDAIQATADDSPPPSRQQRAGAAASAGPERPASSGGGLSGQRPAPSGKRNNAPAANRTGSAPEVGGMFPDFSVQDLDGAPLTLAELRGQMVLVDFWATSCAECIEEMDNVMAAYRRFHRKGFEIVSISMDRDRAPLKNFVRARTITWPQHFDEGGALARRYGVTAPGSSFLLDRTGKIVAVNLRGYALERALQKHLEP